VYCESIIRIATRRNFGYKRKKKKILTMLYNLNHEEMILEVMNNLDRMLYAAYSVSTMNENGRTPRALERNRNGRTPCAMERNMVEHLVHWR